MECCKVQDRLAGYLQDDLRLTERLIVEVHVAHCAACRASMEDVRAVLDTCHAALRHPAPVDDYASLRGQLAAADLAAAVPLREQLRRGRVPAVAGIAAAIAIVVGASSPLLTSRLWFDPLEQAVDEAVLEDMSSVDRASDESRGWRPADELLGDHNARGAATVLTPVRSAVNAP